MIGTKRSTRARSVALSLAVGALAVAGGSSLASAASPADPATAARTSACPTSAVVAHESSAAALRKAIRCRINEERATRGIGKLGVDRSLRSAAQKHVKAMVATQCLAHKCPGEVSLETRIRQSGYLDGAQKWRYSENTGCALSPDAMIANWLASNFHRTNMLDPDYEDVGVSVSLKRVRKFCKRGFATIVVVFGTRSP